LTLRLALRVLSLPTSPCGIGLRGGWRRQGAPRPRACRPAGRDGTPEHGRGMAPIPTGRDWRRGKGLRAAPPLGPKPVYSLF
jgi:hypothetical protein